MIPKRKEANGKKTDSQFLFFAVFSSHLLCSAQQQPQRDTKYKGNNPVIKPIKHSNGNIELDGIILSRKAKEISFEAEYIVGAEANKEYLITTNPDFSHESLFCKNTALSPPIYALCIGS